MKPLKNYQLTKKALEYISKKGRNLFDEMINKLDKQELNLKKEGWSNGRIEP